MYKGILVTFKGRRSDTRKEHKKELKNPYNLETIILLNQNREERAKHETT